MFRDEGLAHHVIELPRVPRQVNGLERSPAQSPRHARGHVAHRREPARRPRARRDDDAAGRLPFLLLALDAQPVVRRHVGARADEEIVEREQLLPIREHRLRQRHLLELNLVRQRRLEALSQAVHAKGQQHAIEALGVGVHAQQRAAPHVLRRVRHRAVLAEHHYHVAGREQVRRDQRALHHLHRQAQLHRRLHLLERATVGLVFLRVVGEVEAGLRQVELRLRLGVEALGEGLEAGLSGDQNDLVHGVLISCSTPASARAAGRG